MNLNQETNVQSVVMICIFFVCINLGAMAILDPQYSRRKVRIESCTSLVYSEIELGSLELRCQEPKQCLDLQKPEMSKWTRLIFRFPFKIDCLPRFLLKHVHPQISFSVESNVRSSLGPRFE